MNKKRRFMAKRRRAEIKNLRVSVDYPNLISKENARREYERKSLISFDIETTLPIYW